LGARRAPGVLKGRPGKRGRGGGGGGVRNEVSFCESCSDIVECV